MKKPDGKFVIFKQNLFREGQWAVSFVIPEDVEGEVNVPSLHSEGLHKTYDSREELIMRILQDEPEAFILQVDLDVRRSGFPKPSYEGTLTQILKDNDLDPVAVQGELIQ